MDGKPRILHIPDGDSLEISYSPFGSVGKVFSGDGIEAVWVKKENEAIDPGWFSQPVVDLIFVVQGKLRVEFELPDLPPRVLEPGDLLVLPPNTRCRAYSWPRDSGEASLFLAIYPMS